MPVLRELYILMSISTETIAVFHSRPLLYHAGESPLLSRSGGEKGLRGSGAEWAGAGLCPPWLCVTWTDGSDRAQGWPRLRPHSCTSLLHGVGWPLSTLGALVSPGVNGADPGPTGFGGRQR